MLDKQVKSLRPNREDIRGAILNAALDVAAEFGWRSLTVRRITESIGYTPPIIYQHFKSKDDMLRALTLRGFDALLAVLEQASTTFELGQPQRFAAIGHAYWQFAKAEPELYALMHQKNSKAEPLVSKDDCKGLAGFIFREVRALSDVRLTDDEAAQRATEAWSLMHGFVMLAAAGYIARTPGEIEHAATRLIDDVVAIMSVKRGK